FLCLLPKLFNNLDTVYLPRQLCEDCSLITKTGAYLEDSVVSANLKQVRHQRDNKWLRDGLVKANRKGTVGIGVRPEFDWHEFVPRDLAHGSHNSFVECRLADQSPYASSRGGNLRKHLSTLRLKVRRRHYADPMAATEDTSVSIAQGSVAAAALAPISTPVGSPLSARGWPR